MKAYKKSDGTISEFKFDTDNNYFTSGHNYEFSAVTWSSTGALTQITGPGQEPYTAHDSFDETFDYTVETCNTKNSRRRALWGGISTQTQEPEEKSTPVGQYYDSYSYSSYSYSDYSYDSYECICEDEQNGFFAFLNNFF